MIEYVLDVTGKDKISAYIGHSEGTTQMFIGASMMPNYYNSKINLFVALAPVVRLDQTTNSLFKYGTYFLDPLVYIIQTFKFYNLIPRKWYITYFLGTYQREAYMFSAYLCETFILYYYGLGSIPVDICKQENRSPQKRPNNNQCSESGHQDEPMPS